ncbi:type 4b pilus protein PilO2 [Paraburkholderia tropica]|uniref:type 4b pilus protein PilO2 n=1 Tax=Paraburkholderia tropica TaxID=92647 RepID=UPI002AB74CB3|nr:type 4b pilus protein PilO2 [Paraburkholderia tropica]
MADILSLPGVKGSFIVGLSWRHEDGMPRLRELAALSRRNGRWGAVWRTTSGAVQAGFCELPDTLPDAVKRPSQVRVLAAIVATQRAAPWLGLFQTAENRYWLIAVSRGHEIIPQGDVSGTLDEMLRLRDAHMAIGDWTLVEGDLSTLATMVQASGTTLMLRDLQRKPWLGAIWAGGAVAAALAVAAGGYAWHHQQEVERLRAEHARQQAILAALQARRDAEAKVLPWTREPRPSGVVQACSDAWGRQDLASGSWTLDAWRCTAAPGQGVMIATEWTGGLAADAPGQLSDDAKHARGSFTIHTVLANGSSWALPDADARRALWVFAQSYGFSLNVQVQAAASELPGQSGQSGSRDQKPAAPAPAWSRSTAILTSGTPPWSGWSEELDELPGVRLQDINWSPAATGGASKAGSHDTGMTGVPHWQATLVFYTLNMTLPATPGAPAHHARRASAKARGGITG